MKQNQMSLCGFPKNNQTHILCTQVDRTEIERKKREIGRKKKEFFVIYTREKKLCET